MHITTLSSRELDRDTSVAKHAAATGPVLITDGGRPAYVLLTYEAYRKLLRGGPSLLEAVEEPESGDFDFEPPRLKGPISRPAKLA